MGWHLLSSFWVPGPISTVARHHEMRAWMETGQRTEAGSLLLKTSGTVTQMAEARTMGSWTSYPIPLNLSLLCRSPLHLHPAWRSTGTQEAILTILTASVFGHHRLARNIAWTIIFQLANKILSVLISMLQGRKQRHKGT